MQLLIALSSHTLFVNSVFIMHLQYNKDAMSLTFTLFRTSIQLFIDMSSHTLLVIHCL